MRVFIRACRRPAQVARLLRHLRAHDPSLEVHLVDDARTPSTVARHAALLGPDAWHLHREARRAWVETLSEGSVALQEILTWGLLGPEPGDTPGAAFNCALLAMAGDRGLVVDEDVVPQIVPSQDGLPGARGDPTALEVFAKRQDILPLVQAQGRPLVEAWDPDPPASVCSLGVLGDSGMRSTAAYLGRGGRWLAAHSQDWPRLRSSRHVLRAAPTPQPGTHLMSTCVQLDLRRPVPPLLPVGRNADGLWGAQLAAGGQAALHLPWAVVHLPGLRTSPWPQVRDHLLRPRAAELLALAGPKAWAELCAQAPGAWPEALLGPWRAHLERLAVDLDDARRWTPASAIALHEDLEAVLQALVLAAQSTPIPVDLGPLDPWSALADLARRHLELQAVWPEVWARAVAGRINAQEGRVPFPRVIGIC